MSMSLQYESASEPLHIFRSLDPRPSAIDPRPLLLTNPEPRTHVEPQHLNPTPFPKQDGRADEGTCIRPVHTVTRKTGRVTGPEYRGTSLIRNTPLLSRMGGRTRRCCSWSRASASRRTPSVLPDCKVTADDRLLTCGVRVQGSGVRCEGQGMITVQTGHASDSREFV